MSPGALQAVIKSYNNNNRQLIAAFYFIATFALAIYDYIIMVHN